MDAGSISHRLRPELTNALIVAETAFQARHRSRLSPDLAPALRKRLSRLRHAHAYVELIDLIKSRRIGAILSLLVSNVAASGLIVSQIRAVARQKLGRA